MAAARRKVHGARRVPCVADGASSWGSVQQRKEGGEAMVEPCNHVHAEPYVTTGGSGECGQWEKSARVYASKVQKGGEPSNTGARSGGRERAEGMIDTAHIWGVEVWR